MTIQNPNSTSEVLTLEALQEAIKQLDSPLPDSLQEINKHLNEVLANPKTKEIENLLQLVRQYEPLYKKYRFIRQDKFKIYQANKRNKGFPPQEKDIPPITNPNILSNVIAPTPELDESPLESQEISDTNTQTQKS
ncbi:hypothetical protein [Nostoc sp. FACHB-145]|uniref:hypothetical protein n=1 Tax=Nostoc sp. FACHB-145 TaxID=2692836 RepID=UPI001688AAB3|nr:hypothetical protein [Nostoc sp. FACHB-145]MBD2472377.1 hypothetical protein [Nostoc sp. FACHB-145]